MPEEACFLDLTWSSRLCTAASLVISMSAYFSGVAVGDRLVADAAPQPTAEAGVGAQPDPQSKQVGNAVDDSFEG